MRVEEFSRQPLQVVREQIGKRAFIKLHGEFDLSSKDRLQAIAESLGRDGQRSVVLDLRGLTFVDSSGLRAIIDFWQRSRTDDFHLTVIPGGPGIQRVFALVGLDALLPMSDDDPRYETGIPVHRT